MGREEWAIRLDRTRDARGRPPPQPHAKIKLLDSVYVASLSTRNHYSEIIYVKDCAETKKLLLESDRQVVTGQP